MNRRHSVVLLIEHNPQLLALNGLVLREHGFRLVEVPPVADAVAVATHIGPDLIVTTIHGNNPEGCMIIDRLEAHPSTATIPIIVISTTRGAADAARTAPNVRAILTIPYGLTTLPEVAIAVIATPLAAARLPRVTHPTPNSTVGVVDCLAAHARLVVSRAVAELYTEPAFHARFSHVSLGLIANLPEIFGVLVEALRRGLDANRLASIPELRHCIRSHLRTRQDQGIWPGLAIHEYQVLYQQSLIFLNEQAHRNLLSPNDALAAAEQLGQYHGQVSLIALQALNVMTHEHPSDLAKRDGVTTWPSTSERQADGARDRPRSG